MTETLIIHRVAVISKPLKIARSNAGILTEQSQLYYTMCMKVDLDRNKIGNYLNLNAKPKRLTSEQLEEMGKAAEKEREKLLSDRPELRAFQDRIDRLMQQAGSFENRMSVLGMMMEANLKELQHQLGALSRQTERWRNTIDRAAPSRDELS